MEGFLKFLMTPEEIRSIENRWEIAQLLQEGLPQRQIKARLESSTATITRVSRTIRDNRSAEFVSTMISRLRTKPRRSGGTVKLHTNRTRIKSLKRN
jgi:TrpR family trp operon transcriptional repressor